MGKVTYITHDGRSYIVEAEPGISVMQIATSQGIPGIEAECGGVLSCATCHVYVDAGWLAKLDPQKPPEADMLEFAEAPRATSRLSCQIIFRNDLDGLIVHIPESQ